MTMYGCTESAKNIAEGKKEEISACQNEYYIYIPHHIRITDTYRINHHLYLSQLSPVDSPQGDLS